MRLVVILDEDHVLLELMHTAIIRRRPNAIVVGVTTGHDAVALVQADPDVLLLTAGHPDAARLIDASEHIPIRMLLSSPRARLPPNRGAIDLHPRPTAAAAADRLVNVLLKTAFHG